MMMNWTLEDRIATFDRLGTVLYDLITETNVDPLSASVRDDFKVAVEQAYARNGWFTKESVYQSISHLLPWLVEEALNHWVVDYNTFPAQSKRVGVILAGNIPLVGFHDLLSIWMCGHTVIAKASSKDATLPLFIYSILHAIDPKIEKHTEWVPERLPEIDAVIATGSNNSARYFDYYFGKYPHIIRKNRNSLAVLTGDETPEQLKQLGSDIFTYYGLGCRNVSKLLVPEGYDFAAFFDAMFAFSDVQSNKKYRNNYDYYRALYLLNNEQGLLDNNFLLLKPDKRLSSPVDTLHYDHYSGSDDVEREVKAHESDIQCIVGKGHLDFGKTQSPGLHDYADGANLLAFLTRLS